MGVLYYRPKGDMNANGKTPKSKNDETIRQRLLWYGHIEVDEVPRGSTHF
jgi:hypothetical protein